MGKESAMLMQTRDATIIASLEATNRERSLTQQESAQLLDAILRTQRAAGKLRLFWTPKEDRTLRQAVLRRKTVAQIAMALQRTERAVWQRMQRLRKLGRLGYISPENGIGRYPRQREECSRDGRGVSFHKRVNKWEAYVHVRGQQVHLGYFLSEQDALAARERAASEHGSKADWGREGV